MTAVDGVLDRVRKVTRRTAENLRSELNRIEQEKLRLTADLDKASQQIQQTLQVLGYPSNGHSTSTKAQQAKKGKRIRRTPEQLKQEADAIIAFIKTKGSEGATGPEIRARHAKIGPDLKGFIQKYSGRKLKITGIARSMRYFVP